MDTKKDLHFCKSFKIAPGQTLQNEPTNASESSELVSRACEGERGERLALKNSHKCESLKLLQARLELAPSYSPDWILSPKYRHF